MWRIYWIKWLHCMAMVALVELPLSAEYIWIFSGEKNKINNNNYIYKFTSVSWYINCLTCHSNTCTNTHIHKTSLLNFLRDSHKASVKFLSILCLSLFLLSFSPLHYSVVQQRWSLLEGHSTNVFQSSPTKKTLKLLLKFSMRMVALYESTLT